MALDQKVYPGTLCQPPANTTVFMRDVHGKITNSGSTTLAFICPAIHDSFEGPIEYAHIVVVGANVDCTIRSRDELGGSPVTTSPSSIIPSGNIRKLVFAGSSEEDFPIRSNGSVWFVCDLPPNTSIISYRIEEID
jgi:hypothetical protein